MGHIQWFLEILSKHQPEAVDLSWVLIQKIETSKLVFVVLRCVTVTDSDFSQLEDLQARWWKPVPAGLTGAMGFTFSVQHRAWAKKSVEK